MLWGKTPGTCLLKDQINMSYRLISGPNWLNCARDCLRKCRALPARSDTTACPHSSSPTLTFSATLSGSPSGTLSPTPTASSSLTPSQSHAFSGSPSHSPTSSYSPTPTISPSVAFTRSLTRNRPLLRPPLRINLTQGWAVWFHPHSLMV